MFSVFKTQRRTKSITKHFTVRLTYDKRYLKVFNSDPAVALAQKTVLYCAWHWTPVGIITTVLPQYFTTFIVIRLRVCVWENVAPFQVPLPILLPNEGIYIRSELLFLIVGSQHLVVRKRFIDDCLVYFWQIVLMGVRL